MNQLNLISKANSETLKRIEKYVFKQVFETSMGLAVKFNSKAVSNIDVDFTDIHIQSALLKLYDINCRMRNIFDNNLASEYNVDIILELQKDVEFLPPYIGYIHSTIKE